MKLISGRWNVARWAVSRKIVGRSPTRLSSNLPSVPWAAARAYKGHAWGDASCSLMSRASMRRPHCCPMIHSCRASIATNALRPLSSAGGFISLLPSVSQNRTLAMLAFSFRHCLLLRVCLIRRTAALNPASWRRLGLRPASPSAPRSFPFQT